MCLYACVRVFCVCIFFSESTGNAYTNEVIWQVCVCLYVTFKRLVNDPTNQNTDFRVVT